MKNVVRLTQPLYQDISVQTRYDREWDCHFLTISSSEGYARGENRVTDELTLCLNNRKELDKLMELLKRVTEGVK